VFARLAACALTISLIPGCSEGVGSPAAVALAPAKGPNGVSSRPAPERAAVQWGRLPIGADLESWCVTSARLEASVHDQGGSDEVVWERVFELTAAHGPSVLQVAVGTVSQGRLTLNGKLVQLPVVLLTEAGRYAVGRGDNSKVLRLPGSADASDQMAASARALTAFLTDVPALVPKSSLADAALDDGVAVALVTHAAAVFDYLFVGVDLPKAVLVGVAERAGVPVARVGLSAIVKWPQDRWMRAELIGEALLRIDNGLVVELSVSGTMGPTRLEDRSARDGKMSVNTTCDHRAAGTHGGRPLLFGSR
jgi:hypothetical protein